jgi:hypothetical protein
MVIQRILRHALSTTATYYIKTAAADVRNAMTKLENQLGESAQVQPAKSVAENEGHAAGQPHSIQ